MKEMNMTSDAIRRSRILFATAGPSGKGIIGRLVGMGRRNIGDNMQKPVPILKNAIYNGKIDEWKTKLSKGKVMSHIDMDNLIEIDLYGIDTNLPNSWKLIIALQDFDDKNKTMRGELHKDFLNMKEEKEKEIDLLKQRLENALNEIDELSHSDEMKKSKEREDYEKWKGATSWGRTTQQD